jgi:hypothetical protein
MSAVPTRRKLNILQSAIPLTANPQQNAALRHFRTPPFLTAYRHKFTLATGWVGGCRKFLLTNLFEAFKCSADHLQILKTRRIILYLSILLHYYTLQTIILFPSQCNLEKLICILSFVAICFGPSWPSSDVSSYAEIIKLYCISFLFGVIFYQITL